MTDRSPITDLEWCIIRKLSGASFPPGTASKRFVRDLAGGYIKQLSPRGRRFLAYVANRFRRQYQLTESEWTWIHEWLNYEPQPAAVPEPLLSLLDSLPRNKPARYNTFSSEK